MKVGNSMVVEIHFTLKNSEGVVVDSTEGQEPFSYLHGANNIIEGLEDALDELDVDADFEVEIPPEKGYGIRDFRMVQDVPLSAFPKDAPVQVGEQFMVDSDQGPKPIFIKEVKEDSVIVDGNHPLAGERLFYKGKVVSVREADKNELYHGQVNSPCCSGGTCSEQD